MITFFRIIAFLEGVSYLILIFLAVPVKYFLYNDFLVKIFGMPHGVLFVLYLLIAFIFQTTQKKWTKKEFLIVTIASLVPFGTFYIDRNYLRSFRCK